MQILGNTRVANNHRPYCSFQPVRGYIWEISDYFLQHQTRASQNHREGPNSVFRRGPHFSA